MRRFFVVSFRFSPWNDMNIIRIILGISFLIIYCLSNTVQAKNKKTGNHSIQGGYNLTANINQAISQVSPNLDIGVIIKSMKTGRIIYSRNENRLFVPASILKILTAEAALLYLGTNYKFSTGFYTDAQKFENGVLYGNLYLIHSGDPTLTYSDLKELMASLTAQQIKTVHGNVYIDITAYDQEQYGPGWVWNDKRFCYAAPISASIINHNCLPFSIEPGGVGQNANIIESPSHFYSYIHNSVITKPRSARSCYIRLGANADSSISLTGCMPKGKYSQGISTVVNNVGEYNKSLLKTLFQKNNIQVTGTFSQGIANANLKLVANHQSKPLFQIVTDMLKKSDNIIAGSLFKKLGQKFFGQPGSWQNGNLAVAKILGHHAGVNVNHVNTLDGSGLSPYNQISPAQMVKVLDFAYHNPNTNYEFISALPVAGVDGTLKHRLQNIAWKVRAKTGTISGVNSLAGYAITRDKDALAFVIIINGKPGMGWRYKELEDQIVTAMTQYSS